MTYRKSRQPEPSLSVPVPPASASDSLPRFAHRAEEEFARILDFYQVQWQYEPRSFDLQWDGDRVTERFTPDFYLPDLDLYVELTTLRQSLVTKKNRKLRRLRELHPTINIKLFYKKDLYRLLTKYGVEPPPSRPSVGAGEVA